MRLAGLVGLGWVVGVIGLYKRFFTQMSCAPDTVRLNAVDEGHWVASGGGGGRRGGVDGGFFAVYFIGMVCLL